MGISEERNLYRQLSTDLAKMEKQRNNLNVCFLSALRPEFESVQEQILCSSEPLTLYEVCARLQHSTLSVDSNSPNDSSALVASHENSDGLFTRRTRW